jgi:hypothetical protein
VAFLAVGGLGVLGWQRSQIIGLRAEVAQQRDALQDNRQRVEDLTAAVKAARHPGWGGLALRTASPAAGIYRKPDSAAVLGAGERRVILDQYRDVVAQMDLPAATAARLGDLLTDRVEAVLDAEDAAVRVGFEEGSAQTERAVALAVAEVDRDISNLVGPDGIRRLDGLSAASPEPAAVPQAVSAPTFVTVVVQAPPAPTYADVAQAPADTDLQPYPYWYYPSGGYVNVPQGGNGFAGERPRAARQHRAYHPAPIMAALGYGRSIVNPHGSPGRR